MIPLSYTIRNLMSHKVTTLLTVLGISLVVFVFSGSLMLSSGLRKTLVSTGTDGNVIAVRKASQTEVMSIVPYDQAQIVRALPEIASDENGELLYTNEVYVLIALPNRESGEDANVVVRGVTDMSFRLRPNVKLIEGRLWRDEGSEIIAGKSAAQRFTGCGLGEKVRFGMREWTVVGIFDAEGSGFDSELWGEINQMSDAFRRPIYSSLTFRLADTARLPSLVEKIENDRRLALDVKTEKDYYAAQSRTMSTLIRVAGSAISIIFSLGAIVGAMITMYAAVAGRIREIGTMRSLGFSQFSISVSFLFESLVISLAGGLTGLLVAYFLRFLRVSTTNWDTFSEIAFNFNMSPGIALSGLLFALLMGLAGGFLPAVRAARLNIIDSLRA